MFTSDSLHCLVALPVKSKGKFFLSKGKFKFQSHYASLK